MCGQLRNSRPPGNALRKGCLTLPALEVNVAIPGRPPLLTVVTELDEENWMEACKEGFS